jgi:PAS domain S-box-containing protein
VRHKNGHYLWVEDRVVLVRNAEGTPIRFVGSTTDISERKRSLIELQETAERLRMAQRAAHAGWWDWDMVTNQVSWSEEYYDLFGIEPTVVPSYHDWLDSIVKEDRERIERETREAIEQRQEINIEFRVQHPIRGIRWLNAIGKTSYREGQPVRMTGITLDITGRKQAEEAIQEKEQQLSFALEAANMVAYNWNIKSDRVIQSENAAYVLGLPLGTTIQTGAEFFSLIHPDDRERVIEAINHTHAGKQEYVCEFRLLCPDGNIRWMADRGWMSFDESGLPLCLSGMIFEITNRKKSEAALRESVAILNAINKATPTLIFAKDRSGRMIMANPATINLIGKSEAEIIGHTALDFLSDRTEGEKIRENDRQVIEIGEVKVFEETVEFEAGKRIFLSTKSPYRDEQGNIIGLIGISTDITERKQTEEKLIQQAQLLDLAYEAILVRDLDSRITYWNNSAREMYGWTSDEASGQISHTLLQTKYCNAAAKSGSIEKIKSSCVGVNQDSVLLETAQWKGELIHTCKGGTEITVESRQVLVIDNQGNPIKILEVNRDITERKQSEEALRRSEEFNRRILDSSKDCIKVLDLEGRLLYINEGGQKLLEIEDLTTCLNQDWICFWQDADRESLHRAIATAKSGGIGTFEGYCRTAKDTPKWWEVVISPMLDATGEVERLLCIARDITARKQAQTEREQILARLQQYAKQLQGLTEAALATNSALSLEEVLNTITEQARSIIGAHQSVTSITVDQDWAQAIHSISLSDKYAAWRDYQESPDGSGIYACVCNSNLPMRMTQAELEAHPRWHGFGKAAGSHPPLRGWLAAPLVAKDGRNMGLIHLSDKYEGEFSEEDEAIAVQLAQMASVAIENSRLYEAEQKACSQAEAANRVKDEFLAILSHELRSPLNPILGWTQLLQTYQFDAEKNNQAIVTIERNAKLLNQLIDDLLDVNRILRGKLTLDVAPINLVFIIEAALETVNTAATAKSITIQTNLCSVAYVSGDSGRLQQIIWNLLSNAVKFTPHGGRVEIKLECINNQAQISISDTGRGIAPEFLPYVFEYFRQADASVTRKHGGLGLGLAIVRYLVELHGGEVAAESPGVGQGATFTVSLPLVKAQNLSNHKNEFFKETIDLTGVRVLIVDDEIDTREFLVLMLQQYKAEATSVSSAMEVSLALRTFKPNILVSDIGMPVIDGYTLLRSIRSLPPEEGGQIPAIALTAYAREEDRQQALSAGFQRHLAKPIEPNILAEAIISILANWREAQHLYP